MPKDKNPNNKTIKLIPPRNKNSTFTEHLPKSNSKSKVNPFDLNFDLVVDKIDDYNMITQNININQNITVNHIQNNELDKK